MLVCVNLNAHTPKSLYQDLRRGDRRLLKATLAVLPAPEFKSKIGLRPRSPFLLGAVLIALAVFFIHSTPPVVAESDDLITVWSATLTVKRATGIHDGTGCRNGGLANHACSSTSVLSDDGFTYDGVDYKVREAFLRPSPRNTYFDFGFNKSAMNLKTSGLTLHVDGRRFALADATLLSSVGESHALAQWFMPGLSWSVNQQVSLSLKAPAPPGPVQDLVLSTTSDADSITVNWNAPATGGTPTDYIVRVNKPRRTETSEAGQTTLTFNNVRPGKIYQVQVWARNATGQGDRVSQKIRLNPEKMPGPITNLDVFATYERAMVQWDAPATGGHPWTYIVHLKRKGSGTGSGKTKTPKATESPAMVTFEGLTSGEYKVWVRAKNKGGKGERVEATFTIP